MGVAKAVEAPSIMARMVCEVRSPSTSASRNTAYSSTTVAALETMHERAEVKRKTTKRKTTAGSTPPSFVSATDRNCATPVFSSAAPRPYEVAIVSSTR
eukprot:2559225-Pleurochrysis_carterae.AAC.1